MALGRTVAGEIVRRTAPIPTPLRRGAAAVVVTSGALSLAGLAATIPVQLDGAPVEPGLVAAALVLPAEPTASNAPEAEADTAADSAEARRSVLVPVGAEPAADATEKIDTAALVKAVQLAEKDLTRDGARPGATPEAGSARGSGKDPAERPEENGSGDKVAPAPADADPTDPAKPPAEPKATAEPKAGRSTDCGLDTSELGAVKSHVRTAAFFLGCSFGEPTVLGVAGRAGSSDHPSGKALDFMVDRATGDALANCALRDQEALGVSYVIWRQRINFGSGWKPMADRGGVTANHFDHVHVSFGSGAGGRPSSC